MRRAPAIAVGLGLVALVAGCRSEAESFGLHLTWDVDCPTGGDATTTCGDIAVTCDAHALVRIVPDEPGGLPYYSQCVALVGAADACALAELPIVPSQPIPNQMVRVQVAVWSDEQLRGRAVGPDGCPEDVQFLLNGRPNPNIQDPQLVPALGGEIYFPVGDRYEARVPLSCVRHDLLAQEACREKPIIRATVREPLSFGAVQPEVADEIDVRFGEAMEDGEGGWDLDDVEELVRPAGASDAVWSNRLIGELPDPVACVEVLLRETRATLAATCQASSAAAVSDNQLALTGFVVRKALVAELLHALRLDDVPTTGLVLGLVIDHRNRPVAGARVGVTPSSTIVYPSADFERADLDATSATGIFLSTTAAFDSTWSAIDVSGVADDGSARGGLIGDHVSVVLVRLNEPIGGGQAR
jgi:hypothetical protein